MTTAFFTDSRFSQHTLDGHPEYAERLESVIELLQSADIWDSLHHIDGAPATDEQLHAVHHPDYVQALANTRQLDQTALLGADTYITPQSYDLARLAAGGACAVVDAILSGDAHNGIAAIRPPGHHATPTNAMGFCLFNNIAIAAYHARQHWGLERVAIVDFDVHHGNGTQDACYTDPDILFISSHQSPLYPGTGHLSERGAEGGLGTIVNLPLVAQTGDDGFLALYREIVTPVLTRFEPQLILVSAGFDGHWQDPLAGLALSLQGIHAIVRLLIDQAQMLCEGRIAFIMEGGYDLSVLSHGWLNIAQALLGQTVVQDPFGIAPRSRILSEDQLQAFKRIHQLGSH